MAFEHVKLRTFDGQEYGPVSMQELIRWHAEGRVPHWATVIDVHTGERRPVRDFPALVIPPPPLSNTPAATSPTQQHAINHLIPTGNSSSLVAYYCGIFGVIPCLSPVLGPIALLFGISGLSVAKKINVGRTHSLVGIIAGSLEILLSIAILIAIIVVEINE
jgi:hypothetical protein